MSQSGHAVGLSVVIPCHNEEENLRPLLASIDEALKPTGSNYEIIITDDCSTDKSWEVLKEIATRRKDIRIQRLAFNSGQSAALWAGMKAASGRVIATLDADLQNDPKDLPRLLQGLGQYDCVCGSRVADRRKGDRLIRILASTIANSVRNFISNEIISDSGCCYRVFKRECISELKFFKGMHRFLPTLIKLEGYTVAEMPIRQNRRISGKSHYTIRNRLFSSFYDLLAVCWMKKRMFRYQIAERVKDGQVVKVGDGGS